MQDEFPLLYHHYLSSWESYSNRQDSRKDLKDHSYQTWKKYAAWQRGGADDTIRPWILGFIKMVGESKAESLLDGAGVLLSEK